MSFRPAPTLFLSQFAAQAAFLAPVPLLPDIARDLGVSVATADQVRTLAGLAAGDAALTTGAGEWHAVEVPRSDSAVPGRQEREVVRLLGGSYGKGHGPPYGNPRGGDRAGDRATFKDRRWLLALGLFGFNFRRLLIRAAEALGRTLAWAA